MSVYLVGLRLHQPPDDRGLIASAHAALGRDLKSAYEERRYLLAGDLDDVVTNRLASKLLADGALADVVSFPLDALQPTDKEAQWAIDIVYRHGLDDSQAARLRACVEHAGVAQVQVVRALRRLYLHGNLQYDAVEQLAGELMAQDPVEAALISLPDDTTASAAFYAKLLDQPSHMPGSLTVPLHDADDSALLWVSDQHNLALDVQDMRAIQAYFREAGRSPTSCELQTLAEVWSDPVARMFTAPINYRAAAVADPEYEPDVPTVIDGILKTCLLEPTRAISPPWLLSAFVNDAGVVAVGDDAVSLKVTTQHREAAERPRRATAEIGDATCNALGVLGQPISGFDVLCVAPQEQPFSDLPLAAERPRHLVDALDERQGPGADTPGVPTIARAVLYDEAYMGNSLGFRGTIGLGRRDQLLPGAAPGDALVVIGYRTNRDGFDETVFKQLIDITDKAREQQLLHALSCWGMRGLAAAIAQMGHSIGVRIELAKVPLKDPRSESCEVWAGKGQSGLVVAVPSGALAALLELCSNEAVPCTIIGRCTDDRRLMVTHAGEVLVDLAMDLLYGGWPQRELQAVWTAPALDVEREPSADPVGIRLALRQLLAHPNIASGEGVAGSPPLDAPVVQPRPGAPAALTVGIGSNPRYGGIDPYWMALACCDEALRSVVAVGGDPYKTFLLSNVCCDNSLEPAALAGIVRTAVACRDVARTWSTPFVSSQARLTGERRDASGKREQLPPTLLISALAIVPDRQQVVISSLQEEGNLLYLLGRTRRELGGSHYLLLQNELGVSVPMVDLIQARRTFRALHAAIRAGLVRSCQHLNKGGLAVAAATMSFDSSLGLDLDLATAILDEDCRNDAIVLFSETPSRFLVEVRPGDSAGFGALMEGVEVALVGFVTAAPVLQVQGLDGREVLHEPISGLRAAWQQAR